MSVSKKESIKQISNRLGIPERSISRYKAEGCNIYDDDELEQFRAAQTYVGANESPDTDDALELKVRKLKAETGIKEKQEELLHLELEQERKNLIKIQDVTDTMIQIAARMKSSLKAFIISMPPKLAGLDERQMRTILEEDIYNLLSELNAEFSIDEEDFND